MAANPDPTPTRQQVEEAYELANLYNAGKIELSDAVQTELKRIINNFDAYLIINNDNEEEAFADMEVQRQSEQ